MSNHIRSFSKSLFTPSETFQTLRPTISNSKQFQSSSSFFPSKSKELCELTINWLYLIHKAHLFIESQRYIEIDISPQFSNSKKMFEYAIQQVREQEALVGGSYLNFFNHPVHENQIPQSYLKMLKSIYTDERNQFLTVNSDQLVNRAEQVSLLQNDVTQHLINILMREMNELERRYTIFESKVEENRGKVLEFLESSRPSAFNLKQVMNLIKFSRIQFFNVNIIFDVSERYQILEQSLQITPPTLQKRIMTRKSSEIEQKTHKKSNSIIERRLSTQSHYEKNETLKKSNSKNHSKTQTPSNSSNQMKTCPYEGYQKDVSYESIQQQVRNLKRAIFSPLKKKISKEQNKENFYQTSNNLTKMEQIYSQNIRQETIKKIQKNQGYDSLTSAQKEINLVHLKQQLVQQLPYDYYFDTDKFVQKSGQNEAQALLKLADTFQQLQDYKSGLKPAIIALKIFNQQSLMYQTLPVLNLVSHLQFKCKMNKESLDSVKEALRIIQLYHVNENLQLSQSQKLALDNHQFRNLIFSPEHFNNQYNLLTYQQHMNLITTSYYFCKNELKQVSEENDKNQISGIIVNPKKFCVFLDLDETLIKTQESTTIIENLQYFYMAMQLGNSQEAKVFKRPHVEYFIEAVSEFADIYIYTAGTAEYACAVTQKLDKNNKVKGVLARHNCTKIEDYYIKDLNKIQNLDLSKTVLVDNFPLSYCNNWDNGIPILEWHNDPNDNELLYLIPFLKQASEQPDVRKFLKDKLKIEQLLNIHQNNLPFLTGKQYQI